MKKKHNKKHKKIIAPIEKYIFMLQRNYVIYFMYDFLNTFFFIKMNLFLSFLMR